MLIKMEDINIINYFFENDIDIPNGMSVSVVDLPSEVDKSFEIEKVKQEKRHANMKFTFSNPNYSGLGDKFDWALSCIVISYSYLLNNQSNISYSPGEGSIASFAKEDYYLPLKNFIDEIKFHFESKNLKTTEFIDSPQHYDRLFFENSGLGWQGKSTMMLSPGIGPWQLIGNIYVEKKFSKENQNTYSCGSCNLCQISCPTGALDESYKLDSNKCISYWLQSPEIIPHDMRSKIGNRFYGCDECLLSCPPGQNKNINIRKNESVNLIEILNTDSESLVEKFNWFYIPKRNGDYLKRNALIALANNPVEKSKEIFLKMLNSDSEMIRLYSIWALWKIDEFESISEYFLIENENSNLVLDEYQRLNRMIYSNK